MTTCSINTQGGAYFEGSSQITGDIVNRDKIINNFTFIVTINDDSHMAVELPKKDWVAVVQDWLRTKGNTFNNIAPSDFPHSVTILPRPVTSTCASTTPHRITMDQCGNLSDMKPRWIGETLIVPVKSDQAVPIAIYGTTRNRTVQVRLNAENNLMLQSWEPRAAFELADDIMRRQQTFGAWPYRGHAWQIEQINLEHDFPLDSQTALVFDPNLARTAWSIWHQANGITEEKFLVILIDQEATAK